MAGEEIAGALELALSATAGGPLELVEPASVLLDLLSRHPGEILDRIGPERGVHGPDDVFVTDDGTLYWTELMGGNVGMLKPDGTFKRQEVGPGVNPITMSDDGRLFVLTCFDQEKLLETGTAGRFDVISPTGEFVEQLTLTVPGFDGDKDALIFLDGESFVVIRFKEPKKFKTDFVYLQSMIHDSFMSRRNTLVVPGGKMGFAMEVVLGPIIEQMMHERG